MGAMYVSGSMYVLETASQGEGKGVQMCWGEKVEQVGFKR